MLAPTVLLCNAAEQGDSRSPCGAEVPALSSGGVQRACERGSASDPDKAEKGA